jgi:hypothetical protein
LACLAERYFLVSNAKKKVAVDPHFRFNWKGKAGEILRNHTNLRAQYFEQTSDDFFLNSASKVFKKKLGICLVDGMHEFRYALNDVLNTLDHLSDDGIIIMHDCNPQSAEAECTFEDWKKRNFGGLWNGDVWKVIVYLRIFRTDLNVFVADCDHGLGIITRGNKQSYYNQFSSYEQIDALTYKDLSENREAFLNLKPVSYLKDFIR